MGFFGRFNQETYDRQYTDQQLAKRALVYFKPHKKNLLIITITVIIMALVAAAQPVIISNGLDAASNHQDNTIYYILGLLFLIAITNYVTNLFNRYALYNMLADIIVHLSEDAFHSAIYHDLSFYDEIITGKIVSRITSDTQEFGNIVSIIADVITQTVQALILMIIMFGIEWRLTLLSLLVIPLTMMVAFFYRNFARKATRQGMRAMANVNSTIKETISGIAIAKNFRQETSTYDEFDDANQKSYDVNIRRGLVMHLMFPSLRIIGGISTALLVYYGGISAVAGAISIGAWYLFLQSLDRFLFPILNLSSFWTNIQNGLTAAERVFALIDAPPTVVQTGSQPVKTIKGEILFDNVTFSYNPSEAILENLNLHIQPGETLAFVGHTGSGKTSIARLIQRFYEFQDGRILIDGQDIRSLDLHQYRRKLGIVSQVPFLFSGTVLENIQYARQSTTPKEIMDIANQIGSGEWLETLPNGLSTEVGERGGKLSMGQRQLISIMRVLVLKPSIFILDEATASIDPFTEWQIQQALNLITKTSTSILIAHRLSTVKSADRIITLEHGKIIEEGSHDQLINQGGHYSELYQTYFRHQSLSYIEQSGKFRGKPAQNNNPDQTASESGQMV